MNAAKIIPFTKPQPTSQEAKSMYSDRFTQGYVMSSRLYRQEVRPFLSDAAHNVYEKLEDWINGQLKETDHVSHRQIQGGALKGANKLGSATVNNGLKELIWFGVITVIEKNNKIGNKYKINEISLAHYFEEFGASVIKALRFSSESTSISEALSKVKQSASVGDVENPSSASVSEASIDNLLDSLEFKKRDLPVDKPESKMFDDSVKYHEDNPNLYSLRELASKYPVQFDFQAQAKKLNPELNENLVFSELKNFAQWSIGRQKTTAQNWMNFWIYRIQKLKSPSAAPQKTKRLSLSQIRTFSSKLCSLQRFASEYSNVGETQKQFESRIAEKLGNPENITAWASYLREVGFVGKLEGFA